MLCGTLILVMKKFSRLPLFAHGVDCRSFHGVIQVLIGVKCLVTTVCVNLHADSLCFVTVNGAVLARSSQPLVGLMMNMRR